MSLIASMGGADDRIYVNGIDIETGNYSVPPILVADLANGVQKRPGGENILALHGDREITFARGFGTDFGKLDQAGWGVVFHEDTPADKCGFEFFKIVTSK